MNKKINIFLNGFYICSTRAYKTCKQAVNAINARGVIHWAGVQYLKSGGRFMDCKQLTAADKLTAHFERRV